MRIKSVLQFCIGLYWSVFRATDQYRFRASISSVLCRTGICLYKIEYLMYRDGWSSPHINTGLQLVTLCSQAFLVSKYGNELQVNDFNRNY